MRDRSGPRFGSPGHFVLALLALGPRLFLGRAIPLGSGAPDPGCAPDEAAHFPIVRELSRGHAATFRELHFPYAAYPPTNYAFQAAVLAAGRAAGLDGASLCRFPPATADYAGYPLARLGGVLLGLSTVLALTIVAFVVCGSRAAAFLAGGAVALHPQLVFVNATVNGDSATIAAAAWLALALSRWVQRGEGDGGAAWIGWSVFPRRASTRAATGAFLAALAIAGSVLVWNGLRNGGDLLGTKAMSAFLAEHPDVYQTAPQRGVSFSAFASVAAKSAFGVFRNMDVPLPGPTYTIAGLLFGLGLAAVAWRLRDADPVLRRAGAFTVGAAARNAALLVYLCRTVDFQAQGRYLLPSLELLVAAAAAGPVTALRGRRSLIWGAANLGFLAVACALALWLVYSNPCLPLGGTPG